MENTELENFIKKLFADLPRRKIAGGQKEQVWLKIQNHLRQTRLAVDDKPASLRLWPIFRFKTLSLSALIALLAISLIGGASKASEGSLPGDALYTVKMATEQVEKVLATSDEARVKVGIKHAKRRLEEVQILVAGKKETKIVAETLEALKSTTEQVVAAASAANPELRDNAADLVAEEAKVLDGVKDQVAGQAKEAMQEAIASSHETISKLKGGDPSTQVEGAVTEQPGDDVTTAPSSTIPVRQKPKEGVIHSNIQLDEVIKGGKADSDSDATRPEILPEPTK